MSDFTDNDEPMIDVSSLLPEAVSLIGELAVGKVDTAKIIGVIKKTRVPVSKVEEIVKGLHDYDVVSLEKVFEVVPIVLEKLEDSAPSA